MRAFALAGLVAGVTLLCLSANAQEKTLDPIPFMGEVRVAPAESLVSGSPGLATRSFGTRGIAGAVYDNIAGPGEFFWFGYLNGAHYGDDVSLVPGKQSAIQPQLLTDMDVIISVQDSLGVGRTFDIAVSFWDTIDPTTVAPAQAYVHPLGEFVATFSLPGGTWTLPFDLSGLTGGGLQLSDGGFCVDIAFYEVGTTTYVASSNSVACVLRTYSNYKKTGLPGGMNGFSMQWFYYDANRDGVCANSERYIVGGLGGYLDFANLACTFYGDVRCSGDFNNDGFVDPLDYNQFINAFEAGGCP